MRRGITLVALLLLAGCATARPAEPLIPQGSAAHGDPAKPVPAAAETLVTTDPTVDADDPVLWADRADPGRAVLIGTDKTDGLYVHAIDGTVRQFFADGPLNNVDLRADFIVDGKAYLLVAAAERARFGIVTYLFDPATLELRRYGFIPTDMGEPYGFCMGKVGGAFYLIPNNKAGEVRLYRVTVGANGPAATLERSFKLDTQTEGCVVDDTNGQLYVGEEDVGIWRFGFDGSSPVKIAPIDGQRLTADVEGLTLMRDHGRTYLVASSQGDATYPVWEVSGDRYDYRGRFAVEGGAIDAVTGTDGLDAWSGAIGPYPEGAIAMHDTADGAGPQQNYKIVDWRSVRKALALP